MALAIVNNRSRVFVASPFLYLEVMPKAIYFRRSSEIEFYTTYFDNVRIWINDVEAIVRIARGESERCGLAAMDALHVAAAYLAEAEALFTLERKTGGMHRASLVRVVELEPGGNSATPVE
jgi:predicted nucleic acid-binding protein